MKQSAEQNTLNKDTIIKKLEDQLQMKANEITEKNSQIREVNIDKQKLENDTAELQNLNAQLKTKLQESLKSLESNAQMIQWLNKQLNEKQSSVATGLYSGYQAPKPPAPTASTTFKPTFSGMDSLA